MEIEIVEDDTNQSGIKTDSTATVICTPSSQSCERIRELLQAIEIQVVKANDGAEVFQRYIKQTPQLIVIDNELPKMSSDELLNQIARINTSASQITRVLVICDDSNRDTIIKIMKPVKVSKGTIKLGLVVTPWNVLDFYRQIANLNPDNAELKSRIDASIVSLRHDEVETLNETRLFRGVSEIGQGLRIELGNDKHLSSSSDTADDYAEKIEKALLSTSVEYIQFSLEAVDLIPANVVALMMLINGFANKHKKEILFVAIPSEVKKQIENFNLGDILPLEQDVDLF